MINIDVVNQIEVIAFWLSFTRWASIVFQFPVFEENFIPVPVKVLMSLVITFALFNQTKVSMIADINYFGADHLVLLTAFNVIVGLFVGYLVKSIITVFMSAGEIIGQQMGFMAMRYFDPSQSQQVGPIEIILKWSVIVLILNAGGLLPMMKGALETFSTINIVNLSSFSLNPDFILYFTKKIITSALLLSSPLIFSNLLIMCVLGIIARTIPQMNVLMISFVVNIGFGLFVFYITSEEFFASGKNIYINLLSDWFKYIT